MKSWTAIATTIFLLAGCTTIGTSALNGDKTIVLRPQILDSYYSTQATVSLYTQASINHLRLDLIQDGIVRASKDLLNSELNTPVSFSNLKAQRTYKVQAYAYATAGTDATISVADSSFVNINVGTDNAPAVGNIPVKLVDIPFNGIGTSSLDITSGGYSYSASESISTGSLI